ncbi:MAG: diphthamide biosynthesis enzyme Dph2 [Candidatus Hydrothermarchaeales archaeon]
MYDFEIPHILDIIKKEGYNRIGLQLPEGLKDHATKIVDKLNEAVKCDIVISGNPCYGACDIADVEMKALVVEALFHFGHSRIFDKTELPVYYIETRMDLDPIPLLSKHLEKLPKRIGLIATMQHIHTLDKVKRFLEDKGFEIHIGKGKGRVKYDGQVLGCNFRTAKEIADKVDCFIYIGSGDFHPLGIALATGKKTIAFDLLLKERRDTDEVRDKILRQRFVQIEKAMDAESYGIIIGEKRGQMRVNLALKIKEKLEGYGKKVYLLYLNEISPEALLPFRNLDAFVNTACPRVTIDDAGRYKAALLTPIELEVVLGERDSKDYKLDEIL